ncbi:YkvA family protein [Fusobacterium sp. PH5-44]|uniref:YkvA family protein n=1 Tax=unclassified Fusobacterium TaxID=2648384 RepID=UPI003D20C074
MEKEFKNNDNISDFIFIDDEKISADDINFTDEKYQKEFNESSFWDKLKKKAKKIGLKSIFYALVLYYILMKKEVTKADKLVIIGALGYLITPLDLFPDFIPFGGFADDGFALFLAIRRVIKHVDEEIITKAHAKISKWFKISKEDLKKFI